MDEVKELSYDDAPRNWAICFHDDCPLKDTCLRRAVGSLAPANLLSHAVVLPAARNGDKCKMFVKAERVPIARGMMELLPGAVRYGAVSEIRHALYEIFGCSAQYYRYRKGQFPITPKQQARVAALFRKHGFKKEPHYDKVSLEYYFP